jgi:iron complex transport system permease protein
MSNRIVLFLIVLSVMMALFFLHSLTGYTFNIFELFKNYFQETANIESILWMELRVPRILLAGCVGAALALSGYSLQILVKNPLADPYVLGSSSGASLMVALVYLVFPFWVGNMFNALIAAFIGALGTNVLTMLIAKKINFASYSLVLVGMAISGFSMALVSLIMYVQSNPFAVQQLVFWTFGSFHLATWQQVVVLFPLVVASAWVLHFTQMDLMIVELGVDHAKRLGVSVVKYQWLLLVIASLLTAFSVSFVGPIGFIGLLFPHLIRKIMSDSCNKYFIIYLCIGSSMFLMYCDWLAYVVLQPSGLPVGIVLALIGVPFFIYFLVKRNAAY